MNSKRLSGILQLTRPANVAITFAAIPAMVLLAGGRETSWFNALLAGLTGALVTAGANAINDFFDIEIDRVNRPDRPLPQGIVTKRDAAMIWFVTSVIALLTNILVSISAFLIVGVSLTLLFVYSAALKRTPLAGNIVVASMTGMAFVYGGVVAGAAGRGFLPGLFAFLLNFAREIIKDVEDMQGDSQEGAATYPVLRGVRPALMIATTTLIVLILVTFAAHFMHVYTQWFLVIVSAVDAVFVYTAVVLWKDTSSAAMHRHSIRLKQCMVGGLIAIVAGSI